MKSKYNCIKCGDTIAISKKELTFGTAIHIDSFDLPQGHKAHDSIHCKKCGCSQYDEFRKMDNWKEVLDD